MALKKILIIGTAAFVVLGGGASGALYFLGIFPPQQAGAAARKVVVPPKPILFAALGDVVVSVPEDAGEPPSSFVQFAVQFSTTDPNALTTFETLQPIIKSDIISLLMAETGKSLEDPAIRATLAEGCLAITNNVLTHSANYTPANPFNAAYITNLVVQD